MEIILGLIRIALALAPPHVVKAALQDESDKLTPEQIARAELSYELALRVKFPGGDDGVDG